MAGSRGKRGARCTSTARRGGSRCHGAERLRRQHLRRGAVGRDRDEVRARRASLRLPAKRQAARRTERHAARDAVRERHRGRARASAGCSASPSIRTSRRTISSTSTTRPTTPDRSQPRQPLHGERQRGGARQRGRAARPRHPVARHQPQRRRAPLRQRRQALHRGRRQRQRRQFPDARQPARQDAADQSRRHASRPTIRSSAPRPASTARSGRWACAIPSPFAFQRSTGRLFINDVGRGHLGGDQRGRAGRELRLADCGGCRSTDPGFTDPFHSYGHASDALRDHRRRVLRPARARISRARYHGHYFYADYCAGWIRRIDPDDRQRVTGFASGIGSPGRPQGRPDGALYYLARDDGTRRVAISFSARPAARDHAPAGGPHGRGRHRPRSRSARPGPRLSLTSGDGTAT